MLTSTVQLVVLLFLPTCQTADINECQNNNGDCSQACINTNGSYNCGCNHGFVLNDDKHTCDNVNECSLGLHNCSDLCKDTVGSFQCNCKDGFQLQGDGVSCEDIDECNSIDTKSPCSHLCTNTNGSYLCSCPDELVLLLDRSCECPVGYELQSNQTTCKDVNECIKLDHSCSHICNNTIGSYTCSCPNGMALESDGITCQDDGGHSINIALIAGVVISNVAVFSVIGIMLAILWSYRKSTRQLSHRENEPASRGRESHVDYNVAAGSVAQEAVDSHEGTCDEHHVTQKDGNLTTRV